MKIILSNGVELNALLVTGAKKYVQGANRDALTFIFDDTYDMNSLDSIFTESNCETVVLVDDEGTENLHKGYVLRTELVKKLVVTQEASSDSDEVSETRINVTMAQRTYAETQIAAIAEELTNTQIALCEIYESM